MATARPKSDEEVIADMMISHDKAMKCYACSILLIITISLTIGLYSIHHDPPKYLKIPVFTIATILFVANIWSGVILAIRVFKLTNLFSTSSVGEIVGICARYHNMACWCVITNKDTKTHEAFLNPNQQTHLCRAIKQYAKPKHNVVLTCSYHSP